MKSILPKQTSSVLLPSPISQKRKHSSLEKFPKRIKQEFNSPYQPPALLSSSHLSPESTLQKGEQDRHTKQARPVTSCTFCRQHKIKCNASQNFPAPCTRCSKLGLGCEIDPQFKPKKGSQIQMLIGDVEELKAKIEMLSKNEHLLTEALNQHNINFSQQFAGRKRTPNTYHDTPFSAMDHITGYSPSPPFSVNPNPSYPASNVAVLNEAPTSAVTDLSRVLALHSTDTSPRPHFDDDSAQDGPTHDVPVFSEFVLGDVKLSLEKAEELHDKFMLKLSPFMPIISSADATLLYNKSQLLFWTVMLTASLSEPEPTLYMSLASWIKQLAIETCWIRTPRSTHVIQALIILSVWPLPNEKVLDDCSYRFVGLAKNLSLQLGLHRGGEFIQEFTRNQAHLGPDSDRWRTRSWLAVFFCDQFWSSTLGLPPSINNTDYLLENARIDNTLPSNFRCLISLSIFQCKLVNVMGISVTRSDGLLEPLNRAASLNILDRELERLKFKLNIVEGSAVEIYYLYLRLMICCFAFLPGTPIEDQVKYVSTAYVSSTRIITISSQLLSCNSVSLIELPVYVRQAITYSAFLLFKLHLSRYLIEKYVDSARQSIVTVHRLYRNTLSSWKDLQNDISRTAKVLEDLNIVLYTYPEIFVPAGISSSGGSIISRMRSHLTASLFYDLVWCIHEARRRKASGKLNQEEIPNKIEGPSSADSSKRPQPLPFYNQITKDDFKTITTTTPNGTTVTKLVPTDQALHQAKLSAADKKPLEINGIPLSMLEATGSTKDARALALQEFFCDANVPCDESMTIKQEDFSQGGDQYTATIPQMPPNSSDYAGPAQQQQETYDYTNEEVGSHGSPSTYRLNPNPPGMADQLDTFFQQQSHGWLNNENTEDDFLGWIDVNIIPGK